jgi:hypothetical protein
MSQMVQEEIDDDGIFTLSPTFTARLTVRLAKGSR